MTDSAERAARRIWKLSVDAIAGRTDVIYSEEVIAAIIREELARSSDQDNPRCFCPDCGTDLGDFYSNRIRMVRSAQPKGEGK